MICDDDDWYYARNSLKSIVERKQLIMTVKCLKEHLSDDNNKISSKIFLDVYELLMLCANKLSYFDFYDAWYKKNKILKPSIKILDNQNNHQSRQMVIKTQDLNSITDEAELLKRFRIRLLDSIPIEINSKIQTLTNNQPQYNGITADDLVYQIEQIILAIKIELQVEKLALFLDNSNPSQLLLNLRDKFSDLVNIDRNR